MRVPTTIITLLAGLFLTTASAASLQTRDIDGDGLYDALYDPLLDITWLATTHLARAELFGVDPALVQVTGNETKMAWDTANLWVAGMNAYDGGVGYLGYNDWRMPTGHRYSGVCTEELAPGAQCGFAADIDVCV